MNREEPSTIEKEKEPTLEDVREYFKNEKDHYLNRARLIDRTLRLKAAGRLKEIAGYEKYEHEGDKEAKKIPGLLEKFEEGEYEGCLYYIEKVLGGGSAEQGGTNTLDLVNHKEYGTHSPADRDKDMETPEYQGRKNYLRKLADVLPDEIYEKRKTELDENLSQQEKLEVLEHIVNRTGKDMSQIKKEFEQGNYREIFEFLDERIYKGILKKLGPEEDKGSIETHREELFTLRRYRRYFLNLEKEK